jgi:hypothetical protein
MWPGCYQHTSTVLWNCCDQASHVKSGMVILIVCGVINEQDSRRHVCGVVAQAKLNVRSDIHTFLRSCPLEIWLINSVFLLLQPSSARMAMSYIAILLQCGVVDWLVLII